MLSLKNGTIYSIFASVQFVQQKFRNIFTFYNQKMNIVQVAKSFGFDFQPVIDFKIDLDKMYEGNKRKAKRQRYIKK